jgi:hypothetical protein
MGNRRSPLLTPEGQRVVEVGEFEHSLDGRRSWADLELASATDAASV